MPSVTPNAPLSSDSWNDITSHINTLAGAIKISSGKVGIGVTPIAPLQVPGVYIGESGGNVGIGADIRLDAQ